MTYNDAAYLVEYYKDKVMGKLIDKNKSDKSTIVGISIDKNGDEYEVICIGTKLLPNVIPFNNIYFVAKSLGLMLPEDVLAERDSVN